MQAYEYRFVKNFDASDESRDILVRKLYSFKSPRSHQTYFVWVDRCVNNIYVVKFHLKSHRLSPRKYNILTNLREPRNVLYTCVNILINEIYAKDKTASFGLVAANLEGETPKNTKRLRFYERFIASVIGTEEFKHYKYEEKSAYIIVPKIALAKKQDLLECYSQMFNRYSFF